VAENHARIELSKYPVLKKTTSEIIWDIGSGDFPGAVNPSRNYTKWVYIEMEVTKVFIIYPCIFNWNYRFFLIGHLLEGRSNREDRTIIEILYSVFGYFCLLIISLYFYGPYLIRQLPDPYCTFCTSFSSLIL